MHPFQWWAVRLKFGSIKASIEIQSLLGVGVRKHCEVRLEGVEPPRPKAPDPKSDASTNSAIAALRTFC